MGVRGCREAAALGEAGERLRGSPGEQGRQSRGCPGLAVGRENSQRESTRSWHCFGVSTKGWFTVYETRAAGVTHLCPESLPQRGSGS